MNYNSFTNVPPYYSGSEERKSITEAALSLILDNISHFSYKKNNYSRKWKQFLTDHMVNISK